MSASINFALIQDVILLLISGIACFYCYLLNRRLRNLSSLKTGVGASIVSLTQAIKETSHASQSAKRSTEDAIETLQELVKKAEASSVKMDAELISLQRHIKATIKLNSQLSHRVEETLPHAIEKAEIVASNLLKVVNGATEYGTNVTVKPTNPAGFKAQEQDKIKAEKTHLKVVKAEPRAANVNDVAIASKEVPENAISASVKGAPKKDDIDVLFDNIDALVKNKGVSKKVGFLESREYYKS